MLRPKHRLEMADARDCDQEARENRITRESGSCCRIRIIRIASVTLYRVRHVGRVSRNDRKAARQATPRLFYSGIG